MGGVGPSNPPLWLRHWVHLARQLSNGQVSSLSGTDWDCRPIARESKLRSQMQHKFFVSFVFGALNSSAVDFINTLGLSEDKESAF